MRAEGGDMRLLVMVMMLLVTSASPSSSSPPSLSLSSSTSLASTRSSIDPKWLVAGLDKYQGCPDGITVVALVNDLYYNEALNWKRDFMDHHNISSVRIINVAEGTKLSYHQFLVYRTRAIISLLKDERVTCLLSADVDTYWVKNPLPQVMALAAEDDYDIIASQGTVFPPEVHKAWGHVLCGGFWMFRRTHHAFMLLYQIASSRLRKPDDQRIVNTYLMDHYNVTWTQAHDGGYIGRGREGIKARTIPESLVQRREAADFDYSEGLVFHPLGAKNPNAKAKLRQEVLRRLG